MRNEKEASLRGFPPADSPGAVALVLGSFPSVESLARGQYYGHPRNHFWIVLGACFGEDEPPDYEGRLALLARWRLAIWDVASSCRRRGSLDAAIRAADPNDVPAFMAARPSIRGLAFNGAAALALFARAWAPELAALSLGETRAWSPAWSSGRPLVVARLPSTSPVPTTRFRTAEDKVEVWSRCLGAMLAGSEVAAKLPPQRDRRR